MKKLSLFFVLLVFSLSACFSESLGGYYITESELEQLESNNQKMKEQAEKLSNQLLSLNQELQTLKTQQVNLITLQNQMTIYCEQLEKENKIIKAVAVGGAILSICGGFFIGYKIAKD